MKNDRMFLRCEICGNIIGMIHDSGATPVCCGQKMTQLVPNTVDAAQEKHVPVAERVGNEIRVKVGSVTHPMLEEHYIQWIAIASEKQTQRYVLKPGEAPEAVFLTTGDEPVTVYEYCNLHGLWATDL